MRVFLVGHVMANVQSYEWTLIKRCGLQKKEKKNCIPYQMDHTYLCGTKTHTKRINVCMEWEIKIHKCVCCCSLANECETKMEMEPKYMCSIHARVILMREISTIIIQIIGQHVHHLCSQIPITRHKLTFVFKSLQSMSVE